MSCIQEKVSSDDVEFVDVRFEPTINGRPDLVIEAIDNLKKAQQIRKEVEVLVETAEKWKPPKKPKKEQIKRVEPSKRLDTWMER